MKYIIQRREDDKYVARSGSRHSYTSSLQFAQTYGSREQAERDKCGNEYIVSLNQAMGERAD